MRAAAFLASGRPAEAAQAATRAAALSPTSAPVAHRHGLCLREAGDRIASRAAFEHAASLAPDDADHWFSLGLACQDLHDPAAAAEAFARALALKPDHRAAFNLGVALGDCARFEDALDAYAAALGSEPSSFARIAQAIVSGQTGALWLDPARLRAELDRRAARRPELPAIVARTGPER